MRPGRGPGRARLVVALAAVALGCRAGGLARPAQLLDLAPPAAEAEARPGPVGVPPRLRVEGRRFVADDGRTVLLRGVNLAGDSKVPPFRPIDDPAQLDPIPAMGFNAVRLPFLWEAFEPEPGVYDDAYLARLVGVAGACGDRGLYVVVDIHQDGFSRFSSRGCGSGFPAWAVSPRARADEPDNGAGCRNWVAMEVTDPDFFRSAHDFYADAHGARTRFLAMLGRMAAGFAACPAVVGYDLLNEPWGDEATELDPLHEAEAVAIRAAHTSAILFVSGHAATSGGTQTRLPRPRFANFAYSPHYYMPLAVALDGWSGATGPIDRALANMDDKAAEWGVPLFVGEYGLAAGARRAGDYAAAVVEGLDAVLGSAARWTYTPHWTPERLDGWNREDLSIVDDKLRPRANFRPRPCPFKVAGRPTRFRYVEPGPPDGPPARMELAWDAVAALGATEIFVPSSVFPPGSAPEVEPPGATWTRDEARQLLLVRAPADGPARVVLTAP